MSGAINGETIRQLPSAEAFRLRMESQCLKIREYRLSEKRDAGRDLTMDEAAMEWICRYAAEWARSYDCAND